MNMTRPLSVVLLVLCGATLSAQSGLRATFLDFGSITKKFNPNILLGFDRDLTDRTSIGIDLVKSFSFNPEGSSSEIMSGTSTTYYTIRANSIGLQYRSQYFFGGSAYIGTTVGFRSVQLDIAGNTSSYNNSYTYTNTSFARTLKTTVFPLGLRFGFRSELDGYYGDIYFGAGYNVGGKVNMTLLDALDRTDILSKLWLNAGYVVGIGW